MVKVKICGITNLDDAKICSSLGVDALGFIFYRGSPRYITPSQAKRIVKALDPFVVKVGVFVDEEKDTVLKIAEEVGLDVLQFHGKESISFCNFFKKRFKVIKVFFPQERFDKSFLKYDVDGYLFDIPFTEKSKKKTLRVDILRRLSKFVKDKCIIVSGGLSPFNIERVLKVITPYAVDVASGVEVMVGRKDKELVREFVSKVKKCNIIKSEK